MTPIQFLLLVLSFAAVVCLALIPIVRMLPRGDPRKQMFEKYAPGIWIFQLVVIAIYIINGGW